MGLTPAEERLATSARELKQRVHNSLLEQLGPDLYDTNLTPAQLEKRVRDSLEVLLEAESITLPPDGRSRFAAEAIDHMLGYGPIAPLLRDPTVTEVMVMGPGSVYIEREGKLYRTEAHFLDEAHLRRTIDKIVGQVGRRIDETQPYVDARLPDGSRINAVIHPVAVDWPMLTIRKFAEDPLRAEDLVSFGTFTPQVVELLHYCVQGRMNILVSGGTGAGKTTTLNVLSSFIPEDERIVTIEDAAELRLQQPHVGRLESRPPNIEAKGEITIRDLVRNALRMRPDRIVVGEVRGGEALDMLQAMNTGHDGSISTIHANSPRDVLSRLETMVLMAGMDLPVRAIREQIASGIQLIAHQARLKDGSRRMTHITEIVGMEGEVISLQDIFLFDFGMGFEESGRFAGHLKPTGIRPKFSERLADVGIRLAAEIFEPEPFVVRSAIR
jgi:pilus assembly protein CpaF